jgi:peptide/nickel transport system permease protein
MAKQIARQAFILAGILFLGGFLAATMARFSPGFGTDERELDPRWQPETLRALRQSRGEDRGLAAFYAHYIAGMLRGDLGYSASLERPVSVLLRDRAPVTVQLVAVGLAGAWLLGAALAFSAALWRAPLYGSAAAAICSLVLCTPPAMVALAAFVYNKPVALVLPLILFPRIFLYCRSLLEHVLGMPHVLGARAKGVGNLRILLWHILPNCAPQMLALAGISFSMALGAVIPIEVVCDLPGIGQLAWKAAMARDLPLLVALTLLITLVTQLANRLADVATLITARYRV